MYSIYSCVHCHLPFVPHYIIASHCVVFLALRAFQTNCCNVPTRIKWPTIYSSIISRNSQLRMLPWVSPFIIWKSVWSLCWAQTFQLWKTKNRCTVDNLLYCNFPVHSKVCNSGSDLHMKRLFIWSWLWGIQLPRCLQNKTKQERITVFQLFFCFFLVC